MVGLIVCWLVPQVFAMRVLVRAPLMEGQPVSKRQIKLCHHGCLKTTNRAADVADWNREELVDHQLGSFA